jgi:hypothetical protein
MAQNALKVKRFYPRGPVLWHLQSQGRVSGLPSSLHPQRWQTLAFITLVDDFATGRSIKLYGSKSSGMIRSQRGHSAGS